MRNRRRYLLGSTAVLLTLLAAATPASALDVAPAGVASPGQKPFLMPQSRPTEDRPRPTDVRDPNRNAYSVPESPSSPPCSRHFCVHWVDQGHDPPDPDGDGVPAFVERVVRVAERVHSVENGRLGWREPRSHGRQGGRNGKT